MRLKTTRLVGVLVTDPCWACPQSTMSDVRGTEHSKNEMKKRVQQVAAAATAAAASSAAPPSSTSAAATSAAPTTTTTC